MNRGQTKDYFESEKIEFYENLVQGYLELSELFRDRIMKIDATKSMDEVTSLILNDLETFIK
jgi:dTMP kinase